MENFDFARYCKQLKEMPGPVMVSELPKVKLDLKGIKDYAEKKGIPVSDLIEVEKEKFIQRY